MTEFNLIDLLIPWAIVIAALAGLRRLERWLAQHIFKVGWLVTGNLHTTTLVYYIFFLPGLALHTASTYLAASLLNVRAERTIALPPEQDIAELKLNFIKLPRQIAPIRRTLIHLAPFAAGTAVLWVLGTAVFRVEAALAFVAADGVAGVPAMLQFLAATPDVWLWAYVAFTIGNTMMPDWEELRIFRRFAIVAVVVLVVLVVAGIGTALISNGLARPLINLAYVLDTGLILLIGVDLVMVAVLGTIEALIERFSTRNATFQKGRLVALTREQAQEMKREQRAKAAKRAEAVAKKSEEPRETAAPSIYKLPLPFPTVPKEGIDRYIGKSSG